MRTLIDIDEKTLKEALKLTKAKTKKEVVNLSLKELVRHKRIERLKSRLGKTDLDLDLKRLERMRQND
ncbi:type II toxin-antitoxin system VapB family antitoxin [candidate division TA06 bacterium]|uniref:Type II toxin-antitoxin system VapB family antitoxin n=1 Tax=candidate division TA06 bacterium TaxID=2250710 RepID=A0A523UNI1_UNCT6|nr:MAG: type II toxin-antitoxin system VapB family antitoxin [candidate division TA06 bacterium]